MYRCSPQISVRLILLVLSLVVFCIDLAYSESADEIVQWVAGQLNMDIPAHMPDIRTVDKPTLQMVFQRNNRKSYLRWQARYGKHQADRILSLYLHEIIGLYDSGTNTIYAADWLEPCRLRSTVAHEATHFFQYKTRAIENQSEISAANQRLRWEIEAHQMEQRYFQMHCAPKQGGDPSFSKRSAVHESTHPHAYRHSNCFNLRYGIETP